MKKFQLVVAVLAVIVTIGSAWVFWPIEWYESMSGLMVKMNRYTGYGCEFMPHDGWGQFPLICSVDAKKTFPPRKPTRAGLNIFEPRVKVADDGINATFVYPRRRAVMFSNGVGATTVYRDTHGALRATTMLLSRVPVAFDIPANSVQAEAYRRYF